jgi:hypothetical protein
MNNAFTGPVRPGLANKQNRPGTKIFSKKNPEELCCSYLGIDILDTIVGKCRKIYKNVVIFAIRSPVTNPSYTLASFGLSDWPEQRLRFNSLSTWLIMTAKHWRHQFDNFQIWQTSSEKTKCPVNFHKNHGKFDFQPLCSRFSYALNK